QRDRCSRGNVESRGGRGRALVITQRVPVDSGACDAALYRIDVAVVPPISWLFKADQVQPPPRCEPLEIGEHLALPEWLEHAVIADVEDARTHAAFASLS